MQNTHKKYDNIYWFLLDGLRPDFLHINQKIDKQNFIDKLCSAGTTFDHVMTAAGGTFTSMHSIFTSLLPSYNGMTGFDKEAFRKLNQEIFTIADYFQLAGYETFRYGDTDLSRAVPMSGFKRWEGSGYKGGRVLKNTRLTQTKRRDCFIEDVNRCCKNKFVYHHIDLLHDLNGSLGNFWPSADYAKNVEVTASEFEKLYYEYEITENDLVILASDHGVILNLDFIEDSKTREQRQYEQSIWAFFTLIGKDIPSQLLQGPVSSLDEMPTILHLAFGDDIPLLCQGQDQCPYICDGIYQKNMFFRETNRWGAMEVGKPDVSTLFCVKDGKWKYLYGSEDARCEWLMDLDTNADYEENVKDLYPELTEKYNRIIKNKFDSAKNFVYQSALGITKRELPKRFSLVLQMDCLEEETLDSLLDMSGPYYEIIALESEMTRKYENQYKIRYAKSLEADELCSVCQGEWIVFITENGEWSEYFLSDLYRYMQWHRNNGVKIEGGGYLAVRKSDMNCNTLLELKEENQVRAIRYLHRTDTGEKYILFGCGKIGQEAVNYFGKDHVAYFADNNAAMVGRDVYGKKVISFAEMKEIYRDYILVITTKEKFAKEIMEQLAEEGIQDYWWFEEYEISQVSCWESGYRMSHH